MTPYNLPAETARLLNSFFQSRRPQNLGLLLDKYVPAGVIDKEKALDKRKDERGNWLRDIAQHYQIDAKLVSAASHRWESYTSALGATRFSADLDWRMVIGFGGNGVLETDLTLHHLYGLPIIPGSALKGLARTYAATEDEEVYIAGSDGQFRPSTKIETDHATIQRIFGMQDKAGTVIFFDAFPKDGQATIAVDIMNPHYPDYYQQKEVAPTNDQNPVPIVFLAIERTSYRFALALRQEAEGQKDDLTAACLWLQKALQHYGIGGKTSAGYGYFKKAQPTQESSHESDAHGRSTAGSVEQIRPELPPFRAGQEIRGVVVPITGDLQRKMSPDVKAVLRYESFSTADVAMTISTEEAQNWKPGETRICVFEREEVRDGCTWLMCKLRVKKDKKK